MFKFLLKEDAVNARNIKWVHQMWGVLVDRGLKPTPGQVLQMAMALAKRHQGKEATLFFQAAVGSFFLYLSFRAPVLRLRRISQLSLLSMWASDVECQDQSVKTRLVICPNHALHIHKFIH